jgi:multiple sugar transport system ATP-binding protein
MAIVRLDRLTKIYDQSRETAVKEVSLEIGDGEFMVFVGPSGCGKTTTLRMIAGLESISSGTLFIDDVAVNTIAAKDRDIAMVFQSYALYPHMSVKNNLAFGLRRRSIDREEIDKRVQDVANTLGLSEFLDRKPHALSGGQRQRVALGRAIVRDPKVFLFDEPLSNLDAALRVSTRGEIAAIHGRLGATMIYVTHDQVEAMTLGTRICIMNNGQVEQVGTPLEVYNTPSNIFVAAFLGNPPMNLLPGFVIGACGTPSVSIGTTAVNLPSGQPGGLKVGEQVTLGIRAEHVTLTNSVARSSAEFSVEVAQVERLGAETIIISKIKDREDRLVARVNGDVSISVGDRTTMYADTSECHVFDASGQTTRDRPLQEYQA